MSNVGAIVAECRRQQAELIPQGDKLKVRAPAPLSQELIATLRQHKGEVLDYLRQKAPLSEFEPWVLAEWRRVSIPNWRRILQESIAQADAKREGYSRKMLREVLADREYRDAS